MNNYILINEKQRSQAEIKPNKRRNAVVKETAWLVCSSSSPLSGVSVVLLLLVLAHFSHLLLDGFHEYVLPLNSKHKLEERDEASPYEHPPFPSGTQTVIVFLSND